MELENPDWRLVANTRDRLGESILWHPVEKALYWIDYYGALIHRQATAGGQVETWKLGSGETLGSIAFAEHGIVAAMAHGLWLFDKETQTNAPLCDPKRGRPTQAYNDGKVDRSGRYWVGTLCLDEEAAHAGFYRVAHDGSSYLADDGFKICNGPAFSPDNQTLYFSDSMSRQLLRYDLASDGNLSNKEVFHRFSDGDGIPDGLTVDSEGSVWCALYGAARVVCLGGDGTVRRSLRVPAAYATSICIGGSDMQTLFVTTGWNPEDHLRVLDEGAGAVYALELDTRGIAEPIAKFSI
ncbi:SMP-30/gluconolactonase/LRE family protein [Rhizobium sp. RAF36]|uniref:SMP-30/gluconolactonase/LRE family protein n=1 Tax=Rhizobium sp. RAF36 TaxID=3233055 RepID=UPI003F954675